MLPLGLQIPECHPQEAFFGFSDFCPRASLVAQLVKNLPAVQETRVVSWALSLEDSLEMEMATHSSFLAWRIP